MVPALAGTASGDAASTPDAEFAGDAMIAVSVDWWTIGWIGLAWLGAILVFVGLWSLAGRAGIFDDWSDR